MEFSHIIDSLSQIVGIGAIALGGSRSTGKASADSDYDIGVYYYPGKLDVHALDETLTMLDDRRRGGLLNPPGAWGKWINGGGWLTVLGAPVDILLRDISRVEATLRDCVEGNITIDYQCGHPFGFVNVIYAAETHYAAPLWQDKTAPLDRLKEILRSYGAYSPKMKSAIIKRFMWEAWFSLECTRKAALKNDVIYTAGSFFRTACAWAQVVYALNGAYLMNEKGSYLSIGELELVPDRMRERIEDAYSLISRNDGWKALNVLDALQDEMRGLTRDYNGFETTLR